MSTFYCISEIYLKTWIFAKLLTPKELIIEMSKRSYFRTPFDTQSWTNPKHCCYVHGSTFILLLHYSKMNWAEKCLFLVRCEILRQFVNRLTTDEKHSRNRRENFLQPIQILLSNTPKTFVTVSSHFWNVHENLKILGKKWGL